MKDDKDLATQVEVLEKIHQEDSEEANENPHENVARFIIANAPLFRYFAEHLSPELRAEWEKARQGEHAVDVIKERFLEFRKEVEGMLETMDPDTRTALTDAAERSDVNTFAHILETQRALKESQEDEQ